MTAVDTIGPWLLGRTRSAHDTRNWNLGDHLGADAQLDAALAAFNKTRVSKASKALAALVVARLEGQQPAPTPTPPAASWLDADDPTLDQGQTGHCVGFTGADLENALPIDSHVSNAAGHDIYYACKVEDGEPDQENGSTIHSLAKVLKKRGKVQSYAFGSTIDDVVKFVDRQSPIAWGIGWTESMFTPDTRGLVIPSGPDVGGHAFIQYGNDHATDEALLLNHWGTSWGVSGRFRMKLADLEERLKNGGEALGAVQTAA